MSDFANFLGSSLLTAALVAAVASLPTFLIVAVMCTTRIPRGIGDIGVGALMAPAFLWLLSGMSFSSSALLFLAQVSIAGAGGGLVYWLLVGRPRNSRAA